MKKIIIILIILYSTCASMYASWFNIDKLKNRINTSYSNSSNKSLSETDIYNGLKEALIVATGNVVNNIGRVNGFFNDKKIHIPLPDTLAKIKNTLRKIGMADELNNLEIKLNRAAEIATPEAKKLFLNAIKEMTINDVKKIYKGHDNAATEYFRAKMSNRLKERMKPIVDNTLNEVNAVKNYNSILQSYNSLPFVKPINGNLTNYVLDKTLNGIFYYLGKEEASIRKNPAKRTTELLKKVFGKK